MTACDKCGDSCDKCCDHCDAKLCGPCNDRGKGGGKGDTILTCDRCEMEYCDRCVGEGKCHPMLCCENEHCGRQFCRSCNDFNKANNVRPAILECNRCHWQCCCRCVEKGYGKGMQCCDHCNAKLCGRCNDMGIGSYDILECARCESQSCHRCADKGLGKGMICCDYCHKQLCCLCNDNTGNQCDGILECDRCHTRCCLRCLGRSKGPAISMCDQCDVRLCESCGIKCCKYCDTLLCGSCNDGGKGKGNTILECDRCLGQSCEQCACNGKGMRSPVCGDCTAELQSRVVELTSQTSDCQQLLADREVQLEACKAKNVALQSKVDELTAQLAASPQAHSNLEPVLQALPSCDELAHFLATLPNLRPGQQAKVPVQALRWTHDGINAQLAFGDDHDHADESIFKLFEQLFRGRLTPLELTEEDPLHVFLYRGPDNHLGLYSRRNRRLATLLMYQALRREELIKVHVLVCSPDDPKWRWAWQKSYDGSTGLSIWPHEGRRPRACHRGLPLFEGNVAVVTDALNRARARPHSPRVQEALDVVADRMRVRPSSRGRDEDSVTFGTEHTMERQHSAPKGKGRRKGKGKS